MRNLNSLREVRSESPALQDAAEVPSPCVRQCSIDASRGWCVGCQRTLDEITAWRALDNAARRAVLAEVEARRNGMKE